MLKDHFQKYINSLNTLRSEHFKTGEYLAKGKYKLKQKFFGKGKKHYDFDLNSQEFFHQYIDDIVFEQPEIQQIFYTKLSNALQQPIMFQNKSIDSSQQQFMHKKNPSQVRAMLYKHFKCKINDLKYKKYKINQRLHNISESFVQDSQKLDFIMKIFKTRMNLVDKQIQQCISRESRLELQDYFQQSYTMGGKPVPVNQNGQPIYKYLDEQECWFSNIARQDIQVYSRGLLYSEQILNQKYWPIYNESKNLVLIRGLQILEQTDKIMVNIEKKNKKQLIEKSKQLISIFQKDLQQLSPGNLQEKQNLNNFVFGIMGITSNNLIQMPILPSIKQQLQQKYTQALKYFFKDLIEPNQKRISYKQIISLIPKINNFNSILFKYQNQQIIEGEQQIKLGLDDDVDIKKQLVTMLEQLWVRKHININFTKFQYKMHLKKFDFQLDKYSQKLERYRQYRPQNGYQEDPGLLELLQLTRMVSYSNFRRLAKRRAQKNIKRVQTKYFDMNLIEKYSQKTDQEINMQKLNDLYRVKIADLSSLFKKQLKQTTQNFLKVIIKNHIFQNPTELQTLQTLKIIRIRQIRTKLMNALNALRCYHRNVVKDLNILNNCDFEFQMDDHLLINSNKQIIEKYQRDIKQNQTVASRNSRAAEIMPTKENEDFILNGTKAQKKMLFKKDRVIRQYYGEEIPYFFVLDGKRSKKKIIYENVLKDLLCVQDRLIENATHFINSYERIVKMKGLEEVVDRVSVLEDIFNLELQFQNQKVNLIERYYYVYQNTTQPVYAHKIGKVIVELIYKKPEVDLCSKTYKQSYLFQIEQLQNQVKIIQKITQIIKDSEFNSNKHFHKLFAKMQNIPLTLWGYIYGDLENKQKNINRLQRMNSISSRLSKASDPINNMKQLRNQIRQQFGEDSEESEQELKIEQYDEYMLRKNMDDIFQDIVGNDNKDNKQKDSNINISSLGLENITLNPRFQGGPYPLLNYLPEIELTSHRSEKLLNFMEHICWAINFHHIIDDLTHECLQLYGKNGKNYELLIKNKISEKILNVIYESNNQPIKADSFHQFSTDDPYHETVIKCLKHYQQTMGPVLDPPSSLQHSLPSTHQRHQMQLPNFASLQHFDLASLRDLIRLRKPINIAQYRQLNLGINFLEFIRLREKINQIQLERQSIFKAYQFLGKKSQVIIEKFAHCYSRLGDTATFLSSSQIKIYDPSIFTFSVYNQSIEQLKMYYQMQKADLEMFKQFVRYFKMQMQEQIRILGQIQILMNNPEMPKLRYRINFQNLLLSRDPKTLKTLKNRLKSQISGKASDILKVHNFLKYKSKIKNIYQVRTKQIRDMNMEGIIDRQLLNGEKSNIKFMKNCYVILEEKIKSLLILEESNKYMKDIKHNTRNFQTFRQIYQNVSLLIQYSTSLPYLSKIFYHADENIELYKKVLYDQKIPKNHKQILSDQQVQQKKMIPLHSKKQILQQWQQFIQSTHIVYLDNHQLNIPELFKQKWLPPTEKNDIFKWMFKIPTNNIKQLQKQAIRHLLKISSVYTGKSSYSQFELSTKVLGSNNKYLKLMKKYQSILQYIQTNLIIISLRLDDDVMDSLQKCIQNSLNFQQRYSAVDQSIFDEQRNVSFENQTEISAPCYIYENKKAKLEQQLKIKISSRGYTLNKQHWAVLDQILDYIITQVQGYGVIRKAVLPMKQELEIMYKKSIEQRNRLRKQSQFDDNLIILFRQKTQNMYKIIWLAIWETHLLNENKQFNSELLNLCGNLVANQQTTQQFMSPLTNNIQIQNKRQICAYNQDRVRQKLTFMTGFVQKQDNLLVSNIKPIFAFLPLNISTIFEQNQISAQNVVVDQLKIISHNYSNLKNLTGVFRKLTSNNRQRIFGNLRHYYARINKYLESRINKQENLLVESGGASCQKYLNREKVRSHYLNFILNQKIYYLALSYLKMSVNSFPENSPAILKQDKCLFSWQKLHDIWGDITEQIDYITYTIYQNLEAYKDSGKIQFTKNDLNIIGKNQGGSQNQYNRVIRQVIFHKLLQGQFRSFIVSIAVKKLKQEKLPKNQPKKIQNQSLIPRVHLIASYSSPLVVERKTYISQQYKLAFVQAFINRFRNKVSRVDLLSAGYGFVITVPDLEDCVNYMNKLLFTFTQKEFRQRLDTFSQYYDILVEGIKSRNLIICEQKSIIDNLKYKVKNVMQAQYLSKVSKLLQQKTLLEQKLQLSTQSSNGLEHRVRKAVQIQYNQRLTQLNKENKQLQQKFNQFKELLVKLFKDTTKNNFLQILNLFKGKIGETLQKKIDLSQSFKELTSTIDKQGISSMINVPEQNSSKILSQNGQRQYSQQDIQKCKIGEDIIHDPYYVTKLINKMRLFNVFKMGCKRIKYEQKTYQKHQQITELHQIQDKYVVQSDRERILRQELIKAHQQLSKKNIELNKTKYQNQVLENQKAKMKILINSKQKKIQTKQTELFQIKKQLEQIKQEAQKIRQSTPNESFTGTIQELPKLSVVRQKKKSMRKVDTRAFVTNLESDSPNVSLYQKFQLSNKDSTWRQKCEQLYLQNKRLIQELQKLKDGSSFSHNVYPQKQSYSMNIRQKRAEGPLSSDKARNLSRQKKKFPNLSFKYNAMKQ